MNLETVEAPVIVNPETFARTLGDQRPGATTPPRRRRKNAPRPQMCELCVFGQHVFCSCKACTCKGEFRERC